MDHPTKPPLGTLIDPIWTSSYYQDIYSNEEKY